MGFGTNGSGDGQFSFPMGVAVDSVGNIFVADSYNHRIQKFDSNGGFLAKWGALGNGNGQFIYPTGIGFDTANNIYVAERTNHRVQKFDNDGVYITQWNVSGPDAGQVGAPWGLAVDGYDNVYVADHTSHLIQKFASDGTLLIRWGSEGSGDGQFSSPRGVAADSLGQVFVADTGNHRIQKIVADQALLADNEDVTFALAAGVYEIAEQSLDAWLLTSIACEGGDPQVNDDAVSVTLLPGDSIRCTFTNTAKPGSIVVTKSIVGEATATFTICVDSMCKEFAGDGAQQTWTDLPVGDYTVSEPDAGPDWIEPPDQLVSVGPGETVEVIVTNQYDPPPTSMCPAENPDVGPLRTDLLGIGQRGRTGRLVLPHVDDVAKLYGQLAAVDQGIMKYVRFRYPDKTIITVKNPTSYAFHSMAVSWWGSELEPDKYIKGQFFWGKKGNKAPRAFVLWPTYLTSEPYADVLTLFDESKTNHVSWDEWGTWKSEQVQEVAIPATQTDGAAVTVQIALVDVDRDLRPVILTVEAGGVSHQRVITQPNRKDGLNVEQFVLEGVAAGADSVTITLQSPAISSDYPFGGDSAAHHRRGCQLRLRTAVAGTETI